MLPTEVLALDPGARGGFLDVALKFSWDDGATLVILLVEHWSDARAVDLVRVNRYVAELAWKHRDAVVDPVILVTDPRAGAVPDQWTMEVAGRIVSTLRVRVIRTDAAFSRQWQQARNRIAACLLVLVPAPDPVALVLQGLRLACDARGPRADLEWMLPLLLEFARLSSDQGRKAVITRMRGEPAMIDIWQVFRDEGRAEGKAEGQAEGKAEGMAVGKSEGKAEGKAEMAVTLIRDLIRDGVLSVDAGRLRIQGMMARGELTAEQGAEVLIRLG